MISNPEDGGDAFPRNISSRTGYKTLYHWLLNRLIFDPEDGVIRSSETSVRIQPTRRYFAKDGNIQLHEDSSQFLW
jgi:hypothetical protein